MLTVEDFIKSGYKKFNTNGLKSSDFGLQKRIDDAKGQKYYITVWVYDYSGYEHYQDENKYRFMPDVQFTMLNESRRITLNMHVDENDTVEDIESFYDLLWKRLKCDYYEKWTEV